MLIESVIRRLRASETRFGRRVAGLAELQQARNEGHMVIPYAYVVPLKETVIDEDGTETRLRRFTIRHDIVVATVIDARADDRNQLSTHEIDDIRNELFDSLLGWSPGGGFMDLRYREMNIGDVLQSRTQMNWQFSVTQPMVRGRCMTPADADARLIADEVAAGRRPILPSDVDIRTPGVRSRLRPLK